MKRLHEEDINKPEWFNHVWKLENVHRYDAVRLREFLQFTRIYGKEGRILDVGAGWWGFAQYGVHHGYPGKFTAIDFSEEARRRTLEIVPTLDYQIGDALNLPFPDERFDIVGSGELIEHMEHPEALVAEMARVCKRGGQLVISTLDDTCEAAQAHGDYPEHLWSFTPDELLAYFKPYGNPSYKTVGHYHMIYCRKV